MWTVLKLEEDCKDFKDDVSHMVLLRFLRSRNHNEKQTYKDLVKYFQWRVDNEVDAALDEHFIAKISNELSKRKSLVVENADHHGRPVNFVFARRHHNNDRDLEEVKLSIIHVLEKLISKSNPNEEKITVAVDLTSFSLINLDLKVSALLNSIMVFYPYIIEKVLIVEAPAIFRMCWNLIKKVTSKHLIDTVHFVDKDELKNFVRSDSLPRGFLEPEKASSSVHSFEC